VFDLEQLINRVQPGDDLALQPDDQVMVKEAPQAAASRPATEPSK
jgi:hypothetical protein